MSKSNLENISNQLQQKLQELSVVQRNVSSEQSTLRIAESKSKITANQLSHVLEQQANLSTQLQKQTNILQTLKHLFNSYRESKGITLNPLVVITETISAEELAHTDVLKEASKSQHSAAFDIALAKITDLDYQDIDGKNCFDACNY